MVPVAVPSSAKVPLLTNSPAIATRRAPSRSTTAPTTMFMKMPSITETLMPSMTSARLQPNAFSSSGTNGLIA